MSSISSTSTLASWDPMELFQLVNPDKLSITCVGYAPSCRRRCRYPIAFHNVQAAKAVMRQVVRPGVSDADLKGMLFDLAEYTLCRRYHQNQATNVSKRWFGLVLRQRDDEDDRGSDTSDDSDGDSDDGASSTGSNSDDSDDDDDDNNNGEELRRRFDELETLQREFEELLQRQRQSLQDRVSRSTLIRQARQPQGDRRPNSEIRRHSTTHERTDQEESLRIAENALQETHYLAAQRARETIREQRRRDRAERAKREEAERQAQREAEEVKAKTEAKTKAKAEAEAQRLHKEQGEAEKARVDRERRAEEKRQQQQQSTIISWETAWLRYEAAWADLTPDNTSALINTDIRTSQIWPTKSGSFASCCEEDVRTFFRCQPGDVNRRILRRQALRWHPDRAARLFACVADELVVGEVLKTVTMISQVVIGIMGVAAR